MALCKNVGTVDRAIRGLVGVVALVLAFTMLNVMEGAIGGIVAAGVGAIMLLTAAIGMCPLYLPIGLSTCKTK